MTKFTVKSSRTEYENVLFNPELSVVEKSSYLGDSYLTSVYVYDFGFTTPKYIIDRIVTKDGTTYSKTFIGDSHEH